VVRLRHSLAHCLAQPGPLANLQRLHNLEEDRHYYFLGNPLRRFHQDRQSCPSTLVSFYDCSPSSGFSRSRPQLHTKCLRSRAKSEFTQCKAADLKLTEPRLTKNIQVRGRPLLLYCANSKTSASSFRQRLISVRLSQLHSTDRQTGNCKQSRNPRAGCGQWE
jgi:hypothetical protein